MNYPDQAAELVALLQEDQQEWRDYARIEYDASDKTEVKPQKTALMRRVHIRAARMLQLLDEIGEPTLSNIGAKAAQAVSILALHDTPQTLKRILDVFNDCYERQRDDTYTQAIPSMTDWSLLLQRRSQRFGTIWFFDEHGEPFLPTVEDFEHVNERRAAYRIEPLRWPKLMAVPESKQPWRQRPLSELVMRDPTPEEYDELAEDQ